MYNSRPTSYVSHSKSKVGYKKKAYFDEKTRKVLGQVDTQHPCDYLKTLIDPWADINAKIPDLACYPTTTARFEANFMWTVSTSASTANSQILVIDLAETPGYFNCQALSAGGTSVVGDYTNGDLATTVGSIGPSNIKDYNDQQRLVSAGAQVKFADNDSATKGVIWCYTLPGSSETLQSSSIVSSSPYTSLASTAPGPLNSGNIQNQKGIFNGPLVNGATCRYAPNDAKSFIMIKPATGYTTSQVFNFARFVFYVEGCATGTVLHVNITTNWEVIPMAANNNVNISPSPTNGAALEAGLRGISHMESSFGASPADIATNIRTPLRSVEKLCK